MIKNMSVTSMSHKFITDLLIDPFDGLCAVDNEGCFENYSLDQFRRLYNDALESMLAYRQVAQDLENDLETLRRHNSKLEQSLREFAEQDDGDV